MDNTDKTQNSKEHKSLEDNMAYIFFTGKLCPDCGKKFPSALILQDQPSQCPECNEKP